MREPPYHALPLPENIPTATKCIQIQIPDDPEYFRLFYGAIEGLSDWFAYDRSSDKRGRLVARLWRLALRSITLCDTNPIIFCCGCGCGCSDCEACMSGNLRFNCGVLEQFDCITGMWVAVPSTGDCAENPAPGAGAGQPTPGQTSPNTCLKADASTLTPLPWVVNSGDVLNFTSVLGAGTDGTSLTYFCPDGSIFFAGACAGGGFTNSGDPLNTSNHMHLLLKIGSNYYPLNVGMFTVPSGVVNQTVYVQVNTATVANARGQYSFCLTYQNNAMLTWHAHFNFVTNSNPFAAVFAGAPAGSWTPGTGFTQGNFDTGDHVTGVYLHATIDPCTITQVEFAGLTTLGSVPGPVLPDNAQAIVLNGTLHGGISFGSVVNGPQAYSTNAGLPVSGVTSLDIFSFSCEIGASMPYCGGDVTISQSDVFGTGTPPTQFVPYLI